MSKNAVDEIKKLKPEFAQKYIVNLKGKDFVLYNGLLLLAKEKGMKSFSTSVIQFPAKENDYTAICATTVVGYETVNGEVTEVEYSEIGDANVTNTNKGVAAHYIRMAATRSKGRALRDFLGVDAVMVEELGEGVFQSNDPNKKPINKDQITEITNLKNALAWDGDTTKNFAVKSTGQGDVMKFTEAMANTLINDMKLEVANNMNK